MGTLPGLIVVAAVILNTTVARRLASSRPLGGFQRSSETADAAIVAGEDRDAGGYGDELADGPAAADEVFREHRR